MSDPEKLSPDQEAVLMELEMILTTVKQIDSNLQKSIALLDDKSIDYTEIVHTNTRRIVEILELLGATHQWRCQSVSMHHITLRSFLFFFLYLSIFYSLHS